MRAPSQGTTNLVLPGKVQLRHLDRLAIVYVRQSTLQQLEQHRESTALQYGPMPVREGIARCEGFLADAAGSRCSL